MSAITVRNLPEATYYALKLRARQHGRSTEAEVRLILQAAVEPPLTLAVAFACEPASADDFDFDFELPQRTDLARMAELS